MTFFIMSPVWDNINHDALAPYRASQISSEEALDRASGHIRGFMLKQARAKDVEFFVALAKLPPTPPDKLPLRVVVPGFRHQRAADGLPDGLSHPGAHSFSSTWWSARC